MLYLEILFYGILTLSPIIFLVGWVLFDGLPIIKKYYYNTTVFDEFFGLTKEQVKTLLESYKEPLFLNIDNNDLIFHYDHVGCCYKVEIQSHLIDDKISDFISLLQNKYLTEYYFSINASTSKTKITKWTSEDNLFYISKKLMKKYYKENDRLDKIREKEIIEDYQRNV